MKENYVGISQNWNWILQMTFDGETTEMKVIDLEKLYNFVVDNFFVWDHFVKENYVWTSQIWNLNFSNDLGWRNHQNGSCISRKIIKLCSWQLFHLKSSCLGKLHLNFSNLKFKFCKRPRMEKLPKWKL